MATNTQTKADYKDKLDNSSDIQKVTYFSDGRTLNVTLWLGDTMPENPTREGANNLVYGILIDVDNNPTTGKFGVDYQKEIQWSNTTQQWNNFIAEYSSPGHLIINQILPHWICYVLQSDQVNQVCLCLFMRTVFSIL